MERNHKKKGILFACTAASLWAVSGLSGQVLFTKFGFSAEWLVAVRLFFAGVLLLSYSRLRGEDILKPLRDRRDLLALGAFSTFGMYAVQYTYFKTIELSGASFATVIQFTGPFFIVAYEALKTRRWPNKETSMLMVAALFGVILIASKGDLKTLLVSFPALVWGLGSAITLAFYSLQPRRLLAKYGSPVIVGWGMLLGSVVANLINPLWKTTGQIEGASLLQIGIVVIFGTAVAYLIYLSSLSFISPSLASVLTAFEPLLAVIFSVLLLNSQLSGSELIGFVLVIVSVTLLQRYL